MIAKFFKCSYDFLKIPLISIQHPPHILKQYNFRFKLFDCCQKNWKAIPRIFQAKLLAAHAERLTGRPANNNVSLWINSINSQGFLNTSAEQVAVVCFCCVFLHFIANGFKSIRFKTK